MKAYFIDTSALFKRYIPEDGSEWMDRLFADEAQLFTSTLTIVELASNLQRLLSVDRLIDQTQFTEVWAAFSMDLASGRLEALGVPAEVVEKAAGLLMERYITPVDALQLSTAMSLKDEAIVVSSDRKTNSLITALGMQFVDPSQSSGL
jgi:predicted nucleic acid-binding protein